MLADELSTKVSLGFCTGHQLRRAEPLKIENTVHSRVKLYPFTVDLDFDFLTIFHFSIRLGVFISSVSVKESTSEAWVSY